MLDPFLIPYGVSSLDARQVDICDGHIRCPAPYIFIDTERNEILRLNSGQYSFPEAPDLRAMTDAKAQLEFLCEHLYQYCDLWARPPKLFLESYFTFIGEQVAENQAQLAKKLAPYGSLFSVSDWALSAPRPLPRAQIKAGKTYWPVDFAFWLGDRIVALVLKGSETTTMADLKRISSLKKYGVDMIELNVDELMQAGAQCLERNFDVEFVSFWEGETMPSSPFKGTSLDDLIRA